MNKKQINANILPVTTLLGVLGGFFTIFSILYVLIISFCREENIRIILFVCEGALALLSMFFVLFWLAYRNYKKNIREYSLNICQQCLDCALTNINDGFHNHGLLDLSELVAYEGSLADDIVPSKCEVLVYTSDLATEKDAESEVIHNTKSGVVYRVLYYKNSCTDDEYNDLVVRYGENNLFDLSKNKKFKESFDGKLAETLGFDVMIYKKSNGMLKGYFAVDFVPNEGRDNRACHILNCDNPCNYGIKNYDPFYKEISSDKVEELYREIRELLI